MLPRSVSGRPGACSRYLFLGIMSIIVGFLIVMSAKMLTFA